MNAKIDKLSFPYILVLRAGAEDFFCLNTKVLSETHKPGEYNYETNLSAEEIGQLLMGN